MGTLVESSNIIIQSFSSHPLNVIALRNELHARVESEAAGSSSSSSSNNALARSTTENLTSYTNLSDGSSWAIDPTDLRRLGGDLEQYKHYFGQVKFQWMESNVKRKYLQRLLGQLDAEHGLVMQADCERAEDERVAKKDGLKLKKAKAEDLRKRIVDLTKQLDADLNQHLTPAIDEARTLTREIQDMEVELAILRNSRPEAERMTIDEANQTLDDQIVALQALQQTLSDSRAAIAEKKHALVAKQKLADRLSGERASLEKLEAEARSAVKNKDRRIEEGCRQLADRMAVLQAVLGIKQIIPMPEGELRVVYDLSGGKSATLAIYSDVRHRRITGAKLLDSSVAVDDIVARCIKSNDYQELVLQVLVKIA